MSLVSTKFYDSVDDIAPTINLIKHAEEECHNRDHPHRATERGSLRIDALRCVAYWWSVGGDVHIVVVEDDGLHSTKATVRLPAKQYASFQVMQGPNHTIVVVGVSILVEFVLCRLEVTKRDEGFAITVPFEPLMFKPHQDTLSLCGGAAIRSMALLDIPQSTSMLSNLVVTNGFFVTRFELFADGSTKTHQLAQYEGPRRGTHTLPTRLSPSKVVVQSVVAVSGLIILMSPTGSIMVCDTDMVLQFRDDVPNIGVTNCVTAQAQGGSTIRLAIGCTNGTIAIVDVNTESKQVVHRWTMGAPKSGRLSSVFIEGTDCTAMWSDCEGLGVSSTPLSIFEGGAYSRNNRTVTMMGVSRGGQLPNMYRWSSSWGASDAFPAAHGESIIVLEGTDDARVGGFILHNSDGIISVVHNSALSDTSFQMMSELRLENEYFSHTATRQDSPEYAEECEEHIAYRAGVDLLRQLKDSGLCHLQYLYERTLTSPAQFGKFAEFHYLRSNATQYCGTLNVSEPDVMDALDYIGMCEVPSLDVDTTSKYTATAVLQALSCRLLYLQCVYIGWMSGPSVGIPSRSSNVTSRVTAMVEVTVGAILYVEGVGELGRHPVSDLVNKLTQYEVEDVVGLVSLGAELTASADVASLHAGEAWASVLRHRHPVLAHYLMEAAVRTNDRSGSAAAAIVGFVGEVSSSLAAMAPSMAAVVLERLMAPYYASTRYFWPATVLEEIVANNSHILIEAHGAATLYRVFALRRLVNPSNHSSGLDGSVIDTYFIPDVMKLQQQVHDLLEQFPDDSTLVDLNGFIHILLVDVQLLMARCAIAVDDVATGMKLLVCVLKATNESKSETVNSYIRDLVEHCLRKERLGALCTSGSHIPQVDAMIIAHLLHIATSPAPSTAPQREIVENGRYFAACAIHEFLTVRRSFGLLARLMYEIAAFLRDGQGTTVNTPGYCNALMGWALIAVDEIPNVAPVYMGPDAPPVDHPLLRYEDAQVDELLREDSSGRTIVSRLVNNVPNRAQVSTLSPMGRGDIPLLQRRKLQCRCELALLTSGHGVLIEAWGYPGSTMETSYNTKLIRELVRAHKWELAAQVAYTSEQSVSSVFMAWASHLASIAEDSALPHQWEILMSNVRAFPGNAHQYTLDVISAATGTWPAAVPKTVKQALIDIDLSALLRSYLACASSGAPSMLAGADELRTIVVGRTGLPDTVALEGLDLVARYLKATNEGTAFSKYNLPSNAFVAYTVLERWAIVASAVLERRNGANCHDLVTRAAEVKKLVADRNTSH